MKLYGTCEKVGVKKVYFWFFGLIKSAFKSGNGENWLFCRKVYGLF